MVRRMMRAVMHGGPALSRQGTRAVPSLTYHERLPNFSIGPEKDEDDNVVDLAQMAALGQQATRAKKVATETSAAAAVNIVPQGGLFWDGRADTLQDQAIFPLLDPNEMDGGSMEVVADKLKQADYAPRFAELFGAHIFDNRRLLVAEAMFAVARYQLEEPSFHPYHQQVRLLAREARRGSAKPSCAACNCSTIPKRPIAAAAIRRRRPAMACRRCSPTISSRRSGRRAMPRSVATAIPIISISGSAARTAPTSPSRRNIAACF